jgi:hypothetical protein
MVYCRNCGEQNPDNAQTCSKCGATLVPGEATSRRRYVYAGGPWLPLYGRWWIFIGVLIVIWGITELINELFGVSVSFGAIVAILFGALILIGAARRR